MNSNVISLQSIQIPQGSVFFKSQHFRISYIPVLCLNELISNRCLFFFMLKKGKWGYEYVWKLSSTCQFPTLRSKNRFWEVMTTPKQYAQLMCVNLFLRRDSSAFITLSSDLDNDCRLLCQQGRHQQGQAGEPNAAPPHGESPVKTWRDSKHGIITAAEIKRTMTIAQHWSTLQSVIFLS